MQAVLASDGTRRGGKRPGSGPPKGTKYAPRTKKPDDEGVTSVGTRERLIAAKADREEYMARLAEMEVAEKEGRLVDSAAAKEQSRRAGMAIRDGILSIPGREAARLVGLDDEREIERILTEALRAELTRIAQTVLGDAV